MADVADLLRRSRLANDAFHASNQFHGDGKWTAGQPDVKAEAARLARKLRLEAHTADPEHANPAWALDRAPHADTMAFYDRYLLRF